MTKTIFSHSFAPSVVTAIIAVLGVFLLNWDAFAILFLFWIEALLEVSLAIISYVVFAGKEVWIPRGIEFFPALVTVLFVLSTFSVFWYFLVIPSYSPQTSFLNVGLGIVALLIINIIGLLKAYIRGSKHLQVFRDSLQDRAEESFMLIFGVIAILEKFEISLQRAIPTTILFIFIAAKLLMEYIWMKQKEKYRKRMATKKPA